MEKIRVNRSSIQEELRKYRKCSLFNDEKETTRVKYWRAKTSIACPDSRNDFKLIQCFCCCFFSLLNSLNLVERLITSRYLFLTTSLDSHNCVIFNLIRFSVWFTLYAFSCYYWTSYPPRTRLGSLTRHTCNSIIRRHSERHVGSEQISPFITTVN